VANRQTVLRHVRRICKAAGVPTVSPHGLRGTHASLAMTRGATGDLVASALGHELFTTTERHDVRPEAVAAAQQEGGCGSWREISGRLPGRREQSPLTAPRGRKKVPARSRDPCDRLPVASLPEMVRSIRLELTHPCGYQNLNPNRP